MPEIFTAPWYPWYADDILLSERVELMNLAEEGAYRRALDRAWKKGSIPADPVLCARAIGKGCTKKIAEVVLTMFRPMDTDASRMIQDRLEVVREEQKQKYLRNSAKGKKGMASRYRNNSTAIAQLEPNYNHSESDTEERREEERKEGKKPPTSDLEKDLLILKTESVLNLKLLLDEKRLVVDAIPPDFTDDWGTYLKARMLKLDKKANRTAIISAMGYAVTDYRRDNKYAYEKLNRPQPKLPTLAEKIAEEERHRAAPKNDPSKFVYGMPAKGHLDSNSIR